MKLSHVQFHLENWKFELVNSSPLLESLDVLTKRACIKNRLIWENNVWTKMNGGKRKEGGGKKQKNLQPYYKNSHKNSKSFSLSLSLSSPFPPPRSLKFFPTLNYPKTKLKTHNVITSGAALNSLVRSLVRSSVGEKKMEWNSRGIEEKPSITAVRDEHSIASNIFRAETRCISVSWLSPVVQLVFRTRNEN